METRALQTDTLTLSWCSEKKELREVLKLRKLCFPNAHGVLSEADLSARHLVVRNGLGIIVGAYRVTLSSDVTRFEAEDDFVITKFVRKSGMKAELAWACVHPEYRDGRAIRLLWRGLSEFLKANNVRFVFGLASITSEGSEELLEIIG